MRKGFRKIFTVITACMLAVSCAGCAESGISQSSGPASSGSINSASESSSPASGSEEAKNPAFVPSGSSSEDKEETPESIPEDGGILIVYFSHSGNTHKLTEMIQAQTNAPLFRLTPAKPYGDDLFERAQDELNSGIRPELDELPDQETLDRYDTILLGFPIWWYDLPMPVWTFLESRDLTEKTIIPYFTHNGSSGGAGSLGTIEKLCPDSVVRSGDALSLWGNNVDNAEADVKDWVSQLGIAQ